MANRRDALVAASRLIIAVSDLAKETNSVRATVGSIKVQPDAVNAIPDTAEFPVEVRSISDDARRRFADQIKERGAEIAREGGLSFEIEKTYVQPSVACDPQMSDTLAAAVHSSGNPLVTLPSGATHDASAMSDLCPIAMLFVRCKNGLSHHPDEYVSAADMGAAVDAMAGFLVSLG